MKLLKRLLLLIAVMLYWGISAYAGGVSLVKNKQADAIIVVPDKAIAPEIFAAKELQYHIRKATGAELPIRKEKDVSASADNLVYIGNCQAVTKAGIDLSKLSPSEYIAKTIGSKLFLAGKDRVRYGVGNPWAADWQGTLFAVYDVLENDLGVRWLWPGELGEIIPHADDIIIKQTDRQGKPRFISARLKVPKYPKDSLGWKSGKNKKKFLQEQDKFLLRHRFSAIQNTGYGHCFHEYWKRFGKTNPEFFSLLPNGKREPLKGDPHGGDITMCVSQPKLWKQIIADWQKSPLRKPENLPYQPFVNACENDSPGMCTCATCRSWDAPDPNFKKTDYWGKKIIPERRKRFSLVKAPWGEGVDAPTISASLSDRYAKFYLSLLKEVKKLDPKVKVVGYAYANYWEAPKSVKLDKDIIIKYVPPIWFPYTKEMSREFRENWDGWRNTGAQMALRPNLTHAGANLPIFYARQIAGDFSYAAQRGMTISYFDSLLGAWSTQGPTLYALVRVNEHPEWSVDKILNEYYSGFGKAGKDVKKYFEYWEKYSNSLDENTVKRYCTEEANSAGRPGGSFKDYIRIASRLFSPESFKKAHGLLNAAKKSAKGDKLAEKQVEFLEKGLIDAELTVAVRAAQKKAEKNPSQANQKAFALAFKKLQDYRAKVEQDGVCNFGYMAFRERGGAGWPWKNHK